MRIGFIDYYLDEWHANNYPKLLSTHSDGEIQAVYAYGQVISPLTGRDSKTWCERRGLTLCQSIEEVVERSDALIVLSPDNCEKHEELARLALQSGKKTYVDKTFAPDKQSAQAMFSLAEAHHTPCYSTSALRFAEEYQPFFGKSVQAMSLWGGCDVDTYCIHQLEPMMMLMQGRVKQVLAQGRDQWTHVLLEWEDGRCASILCTGAEDTPFVTNLYTEEGCHLLRVQSKFFDGFAKNLVHFFRTGEIPVSHGETIQIMAIRESILQAVQTPGVWVAVE